MKFRDLAVGSAITMDRAKEGDGGKSLSSHEFQDAKWRDHEPPDTKSQESENDSDYFSAEDEVEVGGLIIPEIQQS